MPDTIQVVRVEINETVENEHGDFYIATVQSNQFASVQIPIPVGDVFELTEDLEQPLYWTTAASARRWVSGWGPVDA